MQESCIGCSACGHSCKSSSPRTVHPVNLRLYHQAQQQRTSPSWSSSRHGSVRLSHIDRVLTTTALASLLHLLVSHLVLLIVNVDAIGPLDEEGSSASSAVDLTPATDLDAAAAALGQHGLDELRDPLMSDEEHILAKRLHVTARQLLAAKAGEAPPVPAEGPGEPLATVGSVSDAGSKLLVEGARDSAGGSGSPRPSGDVNDIWFGKFFSADESPDSSTADESIDSNSTTAKNSRTSSLQTSTTAAGGKNVLVHRSFLDKIDEPAYLAQLWISRFNFTNWRTLSRYQEELWTWHGKRAFQAVYVAGTWGFNREIDEIDKELLGVVVRREDHGRGTGVVQDGVEVVPQNGGGVVEELSRTLDVEDTSNAEFEETESGSVKRRSVSLTARGRRTADSDPWTKMGSSGTGSKIAQTTGLRKALLFLAKDYGFTKIVDFAVGDMQWSAHWLREEVWGGVVSTSATTEGSPRGPGHEEEKERLQGFRYIGMEIAAYEVQRHEHRWRNEKRVQVLHGDFTNSKLVLKNLTAVLKRHDSEMLAENLTAVLKRHDSEMLAEKNLTAVLKRHDSEMLAENLTAVLKRHDSEMLAEIPAASEQGLAETSLMF